MLLSLPFIFLHYPFARIPCSFQFFFPVMFFSCPWIIIFLVHVNPVFVSFPCLSCHVPFLSLNCHFLRACWFSVPLNVKSFLVLHFRSLCPVFLLPFSFLFSHVTRHCPYSSFHFLEFFWHRFETRRQLHPSWGPRRFQHWFCIAKEQAFYAGSVPCH